MPSRNRTLQFAVTGSLLALAPVAPVDSCSPILSDPPLEDLAASDEAPPPGPAAATDRIRARDGGPVVNPGPMPSAD